MYQHPYMITLTIIHILYYIIFITCHLVRYCLLISQAYVSVYVYHQNLIHQLYCIADDVVSSMHPHNSCHGYK